MPEAAVSRCSIVCTESPWFVSSLMMDRALDAIVRRAKTLDRKHDIPYLAGYSKDGKTIYIDRHMPSSFRYDGRDINTDRYLILHEEVAAGAQASRSRSGCRGRAVWRRSAPAATCASSNGKDRDRPSQHFLVGAFGVAGAAHHNALRSCAPARV